MKNWFKKIPFALEQIEKKKKWVKYPIALLLAITLIVSKICHVVKTLAYPKMRRKILASVLTFSMIFTLMPGSAFAIELDFGAPSVCTHHTEHTPECGYIEKIEGVPCGFIFVEANPTDIEQSNEEPITHIHDIECGYIEAIEGADCGFICPICNQELGQIQDETPTLAAIPELMSTGNSAITIKINDGEEVSGASLQAAIDDATLTDIKTLTITKGAVTSTDWEWFAGGTSTDRTPVLSELTDFTIEDNQVITNVANIPAGALNKPVFPITIKNINIPQEIEIGQMAFIKRTALENVSFPKVTKIGKFAFQSCTTLQSVSFPQATDIGEQAFSSYTAITTLKLGANPPTMGADPFLTSQLPKTLTLVDENGIDLTGDALITAQKAYDDVTTGGEKVNKAGDGLWYGLTVKSGTPELSNEAQWTPTDGNQATGTFAEAITAMSAKGGSIKLLENVNLTGNDTVKISKAVTLDLDDKILSNSNSYDTITVKNGGNLILEGIEGSNLTTAEGSGYTPLTIEEGGTATIEGAGITANGDTNAILNKGTLIINSGSIKSNGYALNNQFTATINGGNITSTGSNAISNGAEKELIIKGGTIETKKSGYNAVNNLKGKLWLSGKPTLLVVEPSSHVMQNRGASLYATVDNTPYSGEKIRVRYNELTTEGDVLVSNLTDENQAELFELFLNPTHFTSKYSNNSINTVYKSYNIRYLDKGGAAYSGSNEDALPKTHTYNTKTDLVDGVKSGYIFGGWFTDQNCTESNKVMALNATRYKDLSEIPLYAKWTGDTPIESKITIKINNGNEIGGRSLENAIGKTTLSDIKTLTITKGEVTDADWTWFKGDGTPVLSSLMDFTIENSGVTKVADIPDGVSEKSVFPDSIVNVIIPKVINIGDYGFNQCDNLQSVIFPDAKDIGIKAFSMCEKLTTVSFPKVTKVGKDGFSYCSDLESASFPVVTDIGGGAFHTSTKFSMLKLGETVPTVDVGTDAFEYCPEDRKLEFVDANGNGLTGEKLTTAQDNYDKITEDGGKADDGLWYGWKVGKSITPPINNPAPGGKLEATLTQDKVDSVFGEGNAILDDTTTPNTITLVKDITPKSPIEIAVSPIKIDLGGKEITGVTGESPIVVGTDVKVNFDGKGIIAGGESINGTGGNGIIGVEGSDITIGTDVTVIGGNGTFGGDGINSYQDVTNKGTIIGGNGSAGNGGDGIDTSQGNGNITMEDNSVAIGGNSLGGNGNGGHGTNTGGNTIINGDVVGGKGNGSGNGGNGANQTNGIVNGNGNATGGDGGNSGLGGLGIGGGAKAADTITNTPGNGRKAMTEVDDSKSGTTVKVPDKSKLTDAALTEDEKTDPTISEVKVVLNVEKKDNQPDKAEVENVMLSELADTIGAFFDITLDKIITNASGIQPSVGVANASEEIEITITIPNDMRGGSNYVVIRVHNGVGATLETLQSGDELTFKTDKFSTYAIAYSKSGGITPPTPPNPPIGGGGNGGGNSVDIYVPTITVISSDKPNMPTTVETEIKASVDKNSNATATLPIDIVEAIVKKAIEEAEKSGKTENGIAVVINVSTDGKNANSMSINLPKEAQEYLISNKVLQITFVMKNPGISIGLDLATITEINRQAHSDVQLTATLITNTEKMSMEAKSAIGTVFALSTTYQNGAKNIGNVGSGMIRVSIPYTMSQKENKDNLYGIYADENGRVNYLAESSYNANSKEVVFTTSDFMTYAVGYKTMAFIDISQHWAKGSIEFVANRGLLSGTDTNIFSPDASMTRAMFVTALGNLADIDSTMYKTSTFIDVEADAYYMPYVAWAAEKNIVRGTSSITFSPDQAITRQEMAVIMQNYAIAMNYTLPQTHEIVTFVDNADIGNWSAESVKSMQMAGVIMGKEGNKFDPLGTATRAEVSVVLNNYVKLVIDKITA